VNRAFVHTDAHHGVFGVAVPRQAVLEAIDRAEREPTSLGRPRVVTLRLGSDEERYVSIRPQAIVAVVEP
jgi:hypothetical protein